MLTDTDREAAANILDEVSNLLAHDGIGQVADLIRDGECDEHEVVSIVYRHRTASTAALTAEIQRLRDAFGWRDIGSAPKDGTTINGDAVREALERIRKSMALLQQNAEGCAMNHYGEDFALFGMPGWLVDTGKDLAVLATLAKHGGA